MAISPQALTFKHYEKEGYLCDTGERWIPHTKIRKDLFGFIDVVAIGNSKVIGIQCTTASNLSARIQKIICQCAEAAQRWLDAYCEIHVIGWKPDGKKFKLEKIGWEHFLDPGESEE